MKNSTLILFLVFGLTSFAQETKTLPLYFNLGDYSLTKQSEKSLDSLYNLISDGVLLIKDISAYCDTTGSVAMNKKLANKRLESVYNYCVSKGLTINSKNAIGEEYPMNNSVGNYRIWRRVDLTYQISKPVHIENEKVTTVNKFEMLNLDSLVESGSDAIILDIQFVPGQDVLLPGSDYEIWRMYEFMRANPNAFAFIRGHVCCGNDPLLSSARAYTVYAMLVNQGISPKRMKFEGFSNTIPRVIEIDEETRQMNRRVDVVFSKLP